MDNSIHPYFIFIVINCTWQGRTRIGSFQFEIIGNVIKIRFKFVEVGIGEITTTKIDIRVFFLCLLDFLLNLIVESCIIELESNIVRCIILEAVDF